MRDKRQYHRSQAHRGREMDGVTPAESLIEFGCLGQDLVIDRHEEELVQILADDVLVHSCVLGDPTDLNLRQPGRHETIPGIDTGFEPHPRGGDCSTIARSNTDESTYQVRASAIEATAIGVQTAPRSASAAANAEGY